jgi:hypothetical protein
MNLINMKKIIKLTESDLTKIVEKVIQEQTTPVVKAPMTTTMTDCCASVEIVTNILKSPNASKNPQDILDKLKYVLNIK